MSKIAYIFAGQGAQTVGMGKDLYDHIPQVKELFKKADELLKVDLSEIMFNGSPQELTESKNAQPALLLQGYALYTQYRLTHPQPDILAGHSLGEYTALVAGGVLSFEQGLKTVRFRGELMSKAGEEFPGKMAAIIGLSPEQIDLICQQVLGVVVPANYNSLSQIVISGEQKAVEQAVELCTQQGAKRAIWLEVSAAFHSPLMDKPAGEFSSYLENIKFNNCSVPLVSNALAEPLTEAEQLKKALKMQMTSPVKWVQTIQKFTELGIDKAVEFSPKPVLAGMNRKITRDIKTITISDRDGLEQTSDKTWGK
ncbi:MAG: ACP S-malonyltransferase [bacterium]